MKTIIVIFVGACLFTSCTRHAFLKRKYTPGIFHQSVHSAKKPEPESGSLKSANGRSNLQRAVEMYEQFEVLSLANEAGLCADTIVTQEGVRLPAKVYLVTESFIRYTGCEGQAPKNIPLSSVKRVNYANGTRDVFSAEPVPVAQKAEVKALQPAPVVHSERNVGAGSERKRYRGEGFAVFGLICGIIMSLGVLAAAPVAGLFMIALTAGPLITLKARKNNNKTGLMKAILVEGIVFAAIVCFMVFLIIVGALIAV